MLHPCISFVTSLSQTPDTKRNAFCLYFTSLLLYLFTSLLHYQNLYQQKLPLEYQKEINNFPRLNVLATIVEYFFPGVGHVPARSCRIVIISNYGPCLICPKTIEGNHETQKTLL